MGTRVAFFWQMAPQYLNQRTPKAEVFGVAEQFDHNTNAPFSAGMSLADMTPNAGVSDAMFNRLDSHVPAAPGSPHGIQIKPITPAQLETLSEGTQSFPQRMGDPLQAGMLVHAVTSGKGNLSIVGTPKFREAVTQALLVIASTPTGRRMIEALLVSTQKTQIRATDFHDLQNDNGDYICDNWYQRQGLVQGRRIRFNPGRSVWVEKAPEGGSAAPQLREWEPALAVAHEISHAIHDLVGGTLDANSGSPSSHPKYTDLEEELAIEGRDARLPKVGAPPARLGIFNSGLMADAENAIDPTFSENQVARELGHKEFRTSHSGVTAYRGDHLRTVDALKAYERLVAWCEGNPNVSAPSSQAAVDQICDRALNNFYIEDADIEKTRRACLVKLARR